MPEGEHASQRPEPERGHRIYDGRGKLQSGTEAAKQGPEDVNRQKLHPLFESVAERWHVVKANTGLFASAVAIGALAIFALFEFFVIPGKDATIQALSQRPESTKADQEKLGDLQAQLDSLKAEKERRTAADWRPLTDKQIAECVDKLKGSSVGAIHIFTADSHSEDLGRSLKKLAKKLGCPSDMQMLSDKPDIGVSSDPRFEGGQILADYLRNNVSPVTEYRPEKQEIESSRRDIVIYIGEKAPQ